MSNSFCLIWTIFLLHGQTDMLIFTVTLILLSPWLQDHTMPVSELKFFQVLNFLNIWGFSAVGSFTSKDSRIFSSPPSYRKLCSPIQRPLEVLVTTTIFWYETFQRFYRWLSLYFFCIYLAWCFHLLMQGMSTASSTGDL